MPKFTVILTDEQAARLDRFRAQMGLRSSADVVRRWIDREDMVRVDAPYESEMRFGVGGISSSEPATPLQLPPCPNQLEVRGPVVTHDPRLSGPEINPLPPSEAPPDKPPRQGVAKAWIRTPKRRAR